VPGVKSGGVGQTTGWSPPPNARVPFGGGCFKRPVGVFEVVGKWPATPPGPWRQQVQRRPLPTMVFFVVYLSSLQLFSLSGRVAPPDPLSLIHPPA